MNDMKININRVEVDWWDDWANDPTIQLFCNGDIDEIGKIYKSYPVESKIGDLFVSEVDGFISMFYWEGVPDDGFGRWERDVIMEDGSIEHVIGGWATDTHDALLAGLTLVEVDVIPEVIKNSDLHNEFGRFGHRYFIRIERLTEVLENERPDLQLIQLGSTPSFWNDEEPLSDDWEVKHVVKWRNQPAKNEWIAGLMRSPYSKLGPKGTT